MPREFDSGAARAFPRDPSPISEPTVPADRWPVLVLPSPAADDRVKRWIDVILAAVLLVVSLPVLLAAMLAIRLTNGRPVFFVQQRVGQHCRAIRMFKLRTMRTGAEREESRLARDRATGIFFKLEDDPRTTRLGRWLRKYSVDEIPQLLNVLKGDMSLVGPRPLLPLDFAAFPKSDQMRRFSVKPGVTGLWQVSGRNRLDDRDRIRLDLEYVDRWSRGLDLRILARTIPAVIRGDGAC